MGKRAGAEAERRPRIGLERRPALPPSLRFGAAGRGMADGKWQTFNLQRRKGFEDEGDDEDESSNA